MDIIEVFVWADSHIRPPLCLLSVIFPAPSRFQTSLFYEIFVIILTTKPYHM